MPVDGQLIAEKKSLEPDSGEGHVNAAGADALDGDVDAAAGLPNMSCGDTEAGLLGALLSAFALLTSKLKLGNELAAAIIVEGSAAGAAEGDA